jgi:hypothetical protein
MMISKELLSKVLGLTTICSNMWWYEGNTLVYHWKGNSMLWFEHRSRINIHELAHKCKEWAVMLRPNKHALSSYPRWSNHRDYPETNGNYYICQHLVTGAQFEAETEPEAIFKACQWILDNKINNENN